MSIVSLPYKHPPFPFDAYDCKEGKDVVINNAEDAHRLFNSWEWNHPRASELRYEYAQFAEIGSIIIDNTFEDVIKRKLYCDKYPSVPPFPGAYDDQPSWWFSAVNVIERAFDEATKYVRRKNGS